MFYIKYGILEIPDKKVGLGPFFYLQGMTLAKNAIINELLEPVVSGLGYELVGIEYLPQGRRSVVRIFIDQEEGISLGDCEKVSRQVSAVMDVEDPIKGEYTLEVSSPGLDRPLFTSEHYKRFIGEKVNIRVRSPLDGKRKFIGVIIDATEQDVKLSVDGQTIDLPLDEIEKANLVPEF